MTASPASETRAAAGVGNYAFRRERDVSVWGFVQLCFSTVIFLGAATAAKQWALAPGLGKIVLTLFLYSLGNLVMLRLIREFGMSAAMIFHVAFEFASSRFSHFVCCSPSMRDFGVSVSSMSGPLAPR